MKPWHFLFVFVCLISISITILYGLKNVKSHDDLINTSSAVKDSPSDKMYPPVPIRKNESVQLPAISSESVFVVDVGSGVSLYEKNPDEKLLPASTTKIITALVTIDHFKPSDVIEVHSQNVVGQKMGLVAGEKITVEDLLSGLLIYSANDAAEALAQAYPGGRLNFVNAMNVKAQELHLDNSSFTNPSGLDGIGLTTSARDLARESMVAMNIPLFRNIVGTKEKTVFSVDKVYKHKLTNINELVGEVPGVLGIKTGWTENAMENLVSYVQRDGREVIFVVLKSSDRFGETKSLIEWVFNNYEWNSVVMGS